MYYSGFVKPLSLIVFSLLTIVFSITVAGLFYNLLVDQPIASEISKEDIKESSTEKLEYYWEYESTQEIVDNPDWLETPATYHINDDGFNDLSNYQTEKPDNSFRIITLGDSFTFGHFVDTGKNWTEQLEAMLNKTECRKKYDSVEIINLGMPGFDIEYLVERYKSKGAKYNPDLILWLELGSGFSRFSELSQPLIRACEEETDRLRLVKDAIPNYACWNWASNKISSSYTRTELDTLIQDSLAEFDSFAKDSQVNFYFQQDAEEQYNSTIQKYTGFDFNLFFTVPNLKSSELLPDGHPNRQGHTAIAQHIYDSLSICTE